MSENSKDNSPESESKLSSIGKIMRSLDLAKKYQVGCELTYFDVLELHGYIKDLECLAEELVNLREQMRWISVSERLPEDGQKVLAREYMHIIHGFVYAKELESTFVRNFTYWKPEPLDEE